MAWPKGMKRVGHVNKDGTPHRKRGQAMEPRVQTDKDPRPKVQVIVKPRGEEAVTKVARPVPAIHGATNQAVIEPCPNCGYAYADGGACPECPWTRYDPNCPHCKKVKNG